MNTTLSTSIITTIKDKTLALLLTCGMCTVVLSVATAQKDVPSDPKQKVATSESSFQKQYEKNIKLSRIGGVYIPADLNEAFEELSQLSDEASLDKFKSAPEDVIAHKLHFGLGRWISVFWNLEEGSRYEHYLRNIGLTKVDHMVQFTIVSFHRHLLGKDLEVEQQVADYQAALEKELEAYRAKTEVISTETRSIKD